MKLSTCTVGELREFLEDKSSLDYVWVEELDSCIYVASGDVKEGDEIQSIEAARIVYHASREVS